MKIQYLLSLPMIHIQTFSDEDENDFQKFVDDIYSPVSDISLTYLHETMERLQSGKENFLNEEEYTQNL